MAIAPGLRQDPWKCLGLPRDPVGQIEASPAARITSQEVLGTGLQ
jgi:hypothetical protein